MALTEEDVMQALRDCYDPEIPVNIVDLGLIYKVMLTPDANSKRAFPRQRVEVEMTMTSQGCPSHVTIMEQVRNRLAGIPEISDTLVNLVWEPAWTPDRISQKAREQLGIGNGTKRALTIACFLSTDGAQLLALAVNSPTNFSKRLNML